MISNKLPIGSFVRIEKSELQAIMDCLRDEGYVTVGPTIRDGAIVYDEEGPILQTDEFSEDHLDRFRDRGRSNWGFHLAHPMPRREDTPSRKPDLRRALKMIGDIKSIYPDNFKVKASWAWETTFSESMMGWSFSTGVDPRNLRVTWMLSG